MSRLRDFFIHLPEACGVPSALAKIEGDRCGKIFDLEVWDSGSVFRQNEGQTTRDRMAPAFISWEAYADADALEYAIGLMVYAADCYGANKAGCEHSEILAENRGRLEDGEKAHPAIAELLSVYEASTLTNWV